MTIQERRDHAREAIVAYMRAKSSMPPLTDDKYEDTDATDLIADLLHLQRKLGFDVELTLERAKMHFEAEEADEKEVGNEKLHL